MNLPKIGTRDEWMEAGKELLAREKDFDRERDRLTEARRKLPMRPSRAHRLPGFV